MSESFPELHIGYPAWVRELDWQARRAGDAERMEVAIDVARRNVLQGSGGPFGAALFDEDGALVSVGMNLVVPLNNSVLHAEIVAFMMAEARLGSYSLGGAHVLYSSCEPCAMCLGATLWAGVRRVVWSADRDDALRSGFDEGPVFPASYEYLAARGVRFQDHVLHAQGREVLELYRRLGGEIYNG